MCRIMTSNYNNCISENGISISVDGGKKANFNGPYLSLFAPTNIGRVLNEDDTRDYITEYYKQVLSKLDPEEMLKIIPEGSILLCYEDNTAFCHRHLVAFWFELFLGITTSEVIENPKRETVKKMDRPDYLKDILEEIIKSNYDMNGFDDIKDAYKFKNNNKKLLLRNVLK